MKLNEKLLVQYFVKSIQKNAEKKIFKRETHK